MSANFSDWPTVAPEVVGIDGSALADATEFVRQNNSTCFLVAHGSGLVCAEHWHCEEGFGGGNSPLAPAFTDDDRSLEDVASALGALGRAVHVIPSRQLVVVRMGGSPSEQVLAGSQFGRTLFDRLGLRAE